MDNEKFLLPTNYGANYESTLKIGVKQASPMNPALRNQNVQENCIIILMLWTRIQQGVYCIIRETLWLGSFAGNMALPMGSCSSIHIIEGLM